MDYNDFDLAAVEMDSYCVNNDIDSYDLYGEIMIGDDRDDNDHGIDFDYRGQVSNNKQKENKHGKSYYFFD